MSLIIEVPVSDIQKDPQKGLSIAFPSRCYRCGNPAAGEYDLRKLRILARPQKSSFSRVRFNYTYPYLLRLPVCSDCRQADYVTHPEEVKHDSSRLGKLARLQSVGLTVGGTIAALGILFNTPLIPALGKLSILKQYWMYVAAVGLVITLAMWLYQSQVQKLTSANLSSRGYRIEANPRADIRTPVLADENDPTAIPLEIKIEDDEWARECAEHYGWKIHPDPA